MNIPVHGVLLMVKGGHKSLQPRNIAAQMFHGQNIVMSHQFCQIVYHVFQVLFTEKFLELPSSVMSR